MSDKRTESQFGDDRSRQVIFRKGDKAGQAELKYRANSADLPSRPLSRASFGELHSAREIVDQEMTISKNRWAPEGGLRRKTGETILSETPVSGDALAQAMREKQQSTSNYNKQVVRDKIKRTQARRKS